MVPFNVALVPVTAVAGCVMINGGTSTVVSVASSGAPVRGSSVRNVAKLAPETVPWFVRTQTPGGIGFATMARKVIVMLLPAGSVPMLMGVKT